MTRNHILLDFDGVFRAEWYDYANEPADEYNHARLHAFPVQYAGDEWVMLIDPDAVAAVHRWAAREDTTVYWFSANGYLTYEVLAPAAGFPALGWAPHASERPGQGGYPGSGFTSMYWWKAQAAQEFVKASKGTGNRILWVDDHISGDLFHHMRDIGPDTLSFVIPESRVGLLPDEIARIDAWLDGDETIRYRSQEARRTREGLGWDLREIERDLTAVKELIDAASDEKSWQAAYRAATDLQSIVNSLVAGADRASKLEFGRF